MGSKKKVDSKGHKQRFVTAIPKSALFHKNQPFLPSLTIYFSIWADLGFTMYQISPVRDRADLEITMYQISPLTDWAVLGFTMCQISPLRDWADLGFTIYQISPL